MKKRTKRERLPPLDLIELFSTIQSKQMRMVIGAIIKDWSSEESMKRFANSKLKFDDDISAWSTDDDKEDGGKQQNPKPPKDEDNGTHSLQSNVERSDDSFI